MVCFALFWRHDAMLREVTAVEVSSIEHISALENGLSIQDRNVSTQLAALRKEMSLSSEWVSNIEAGLARRDQNSSREVSSITAKLALMSARLSSLGEALASQKKSASVDISKFAAELAAHRKALDAGMSKQQQRQHEDEVASASRARRAAKQHRATLEAETALAGLLVRQQRAAAEAAVSTASDLATLRAELAGQREAIERLQKTLRLQLGVAKRLRGAAGERQRRDAQLRALAERLEMLEARLAQQQTTEADFFAQLRHHGQSLSALGSQVRLQRTAAGRLEADLDRQERLQLDLAAQVARQNISSSLQSEQLVRQNQSFTLLAKDFGKERLSTLAREEALRDDLEVRLATQQKRLVAIESSAAEHTSALELQLAQQQQDRNAAIRALAGIHTQERVMTRHDAFQEAH